MPSPRVCPGCDLVVAVDRGYFFDDKMNMICCNCGCKIVGIDHTAPACSEEKDAGEQEDEKF